MYISYTSKRRHRADILGPELAPSMVFTNWTAGNSATLSNDASGNLKVAYSAVAHPFAYVAITPAAGKTYRIKVDSISDAASQLPSVSVGTIVGSSQICEFDLRKTPATDATSSNETYIYATGATLYFSLYCVIGAAGYSLFNSFSFREATIVTHASVNVMMDDLLLTSDAYNALNSFHSIQAVFGVTFGRDDNAVSVLNNGAVSGEARRPIKIATVSGRAYKVAINWIPHSCLSAVVRVGTTDGGSQLGSSSLTHDIDNLSTTPFLKKSSGLSWQFTNSDDGWTYTNATKVNNATYVALTATTGDPQLIRTGLSFSGKTNRYVAMRIKRTSATFVNEMTLMYSTAAHAASASYYATANIAALVIGEYTVIVWDMWQLTAGGTDWQDSTITGLRIDPTSTNASTFDIDWIAVGNLNPLELTFTASADSAYVSFYNSPEADARSYYILPHCDQLDSTYTLSQTGVNTLDPMDEYIVNETRTIAGVSYGLYDRTDEGWSIVSDKIEDAAKADWDEFFASCAALENFRFDPSATTDTTTTKTCELVPGSQKLTRIDKTSMWRAQFKVRVAA